MATGYGCTVCDRTYGLEERVWRCACGAPLRLDEGPGLEPSEVDAGDPSFWRYRRALAVPDLEPEVSFGEGNTPLVERKWAGAIVRFKLDYLFPSGSYKDRGFAVLASHLKRIGVTDVYLDSSGNAGASLAAYSAALGLGCTVYVPGATPAGKAVQIEAYGARAVRVPGPRQAAAEAAAARDDDAFYASHNWSPLFVDGVKSLAYELWEQLGHRAPGAVIAPLGYGSLVLSVDRGFRELRRAGQVDSIPRIYGCQAAACAPMVRGWRAGDPGAARLDPDEVGETLAEGVASSRPVRAPEVLDAVGRSGGAVVAVSEDEILASLRELHGRGLYVEPTSAVAGAGARRILEGAEGEPPDGDVVVVLTGHGLKATDKLVRLHSEPPTDTGEVPA